MKLLERARDVVSGESDIEDLHTVPRFPVFMGCVDHPPGEDVVTDMVWGIGRKSGLIQLKRLIPLDVLYQAFHNSGVVGAIWMTHHRALARFLETVAPASVLEIGGAHGILASEYQEVARIPWTILEPNPSPIAGCEARFIRGFFDETFSYQDPFDTVVHSHVFEHMYEPDAFVGLLSRLMAPGKRLVFSIPNMRAMLERKYTNCLNFEHTVFITEPYIEYMLARHGFRVTGKEYFLEDHSIFYAAVQDPAVKQAHLPDGLYAVNRKLYEEYAAYHTRLIRKLNAAIAGSDRAVYLFGAHIFSQFLIASGLDASRLACLLDNDGSKQGKRLYGTDLMVKSPKTLRDDPSPVVILKAGVYNYEIKADILGNINSSTTFLE